MFSPWVLIPFSYNIHAINPEIVDGNAEIVATSSDLARSVAVYFISDYNDESSGRQ
jgi:hypothetical protein